MQALCASGHGSSLLFSSSSLILNWGNKSVLSTESHNDLGRVFIQPAFPKQLLCTRPWAAGLACGAQNPRVSDVIESSYLILQMGRNKEENDFLGVSEIMSTRCHSS